MTVDTDRDSPAVISSPSYHSRMLRVCNITAFRLAAVAEDNKMTGRRTRVSSFGRFTVIETSHWSPYSTGPNALSTRCQHIITFPLQSWSPARSLVASQQQTNKSIRHRMQSVASLAMARGGVESSRVNRRGRDTVGNAPDLDNTLDIPGKLVVRSRIPAGCGVRPTIVIDSLTVTDKTTSYSEPRCSAAKTRSR